MCGTFRWQPHHVKDEIGNHDWNQHLEIAWFHNWKVLCILFRIHILITCLKLSTWSMIIIIILKNSNWGLDYASSSLFNISMCWNALILFEWYTGCLGWKAVKTLLTFGSIGWWQFRNKHDPNKSLVISGPCAPLLDNQHGVEADDEAKFVKPFHLL